MPSERGPYEGPHGLLNSGLKKGFLEKPGGRNEERIEKSTGKDEKCLRVEGFAGLISRKESII